MDNRTPRAIAMSATVENIVAYAERFGGIRELWEQSLANGMDPLRLALLAALLRGVDPPTRVDGRGYHVPTEPRFELSRNERRDLAERLIEAGHADNRTARNQTGVSKRTWTRIRQELQEAEKGGLTPLSHAPADAGLRWTKQQSPGSSTGGAGMASSIVLLAPRKKRPEGMRKTLCGLCPPDRLNRATARATEITEPGIGTTRTQFDRKWKATA